MNTFLEKLKLEDNGGRRTGADRRQFSYAFHLPERRVSPDRRSVTDRRLELRN